MENMKNIKSPFKFENMWMSHKHFKDKLSRWWKIKIQGTSIYKLTNKLVEVRKNLRILNKKEFKNVHYRKAKLKERMEEIE